jgi:hypothetical protein
MHSVRASRPAAVQRLSRVGVLGLGQVEIYAILYSKQFGNGKRERAGSYLGGGEW